MIHELLSKPPSSFVMVRTAVLVMLVSIEAITMAMQSLRNVNIRRLPFGKLDTYAAVVTLSLHPIR